MMICYSTLLGAPSRGDIYVIVRLQSSTYTPEVMQGVSVHERGARSLDGVTQLDRSKRLRCRGRHHTVPLNRVAWSSRCRRGETAAVQLRGSGEKLLGSTSIRYPACVSPVSGSDSVVGTTRCHVQVLKQEYVEDFLPWRTCESVDKGIHCLINPDE